MAQSYDVVGYGQFRHDVYLVKTTNGVLDHSDPILANFGSRMVCDEFCKWYSQKHSVRLCINDLKTDEIAYIPELAQKMPGMMVSGKKLETAAATKNGTKHKPAPVAVEQPQATQTMSTRDMATALLKVIKESKPMPARVLAEKAGLEYDVEVRRVLVKMRDKGYIAFDNGRWRLPA